MKQIILYLKVFDSKGEKIYIAENLVVCLTDGSAQNLSLHNGMNFDLFFYHQE